MQKARLSVTAALLGATAVTTVPSLGQAAEIVYDEMVDLTFGVEWVTGGYSEANSVSADGSVVVGGAFAGLTSHAYRWTEDLGMVNLADHDGSGTVGGSIGEWAEYSWANSVSADGSVVVGFGNDGTRDRAFRWTSGLGMVNLVDFDGNGSISGTGKEWATGNSNANSVSADGSVVVGYGNDAGNIGRAFRWTEDLGMVNLADFDGNGSISGTGKEWASMRSEAMSVSADGSAVVGYAYDAGNKYHSFRWTEDLGMVNLADHDGSGTVGDSIGEWAEESWATSVSADGSVVVGGAYDGSETRAFIYRTVLLDADNVLLDADNTVSAIADNVVAQATFVAALGAGLSFAAETELDAGTGGQPSTVSISSKSYSDSLPMAIRLGASASSNADTGSLSFGSITGAIGLSEELTVGGFASLGTEASSLGGLGFDGKINSFGAWVRSKPLGGSGLTWKAALANSNGAVTISRDDSLVGTEAASGSSTLSSTAASFELGYRMAAQNRITTPFLRLAQTSTTRAAYDEDASYNFPISYDAVTEVVTTATLGLDSRSALDESNTLRFTGGFETDLARSNSPITGTSDIPNLTSFSIDVADIAAVQNPTRGYVGLGLTHDFGNGAAITFDVRADQNAFTATPTYSGGIAYQMKF